jgi:hypothetical protein
MSASVEGLNIVAEKPMQRLISTLVLFTTFAASAGAQVKRGKSTVPPDSMHAVAASCPLDLKNLKLTRAQEVTVDSIRAEHRATMMKLMPEQMKMNMSGRAGMKMPPADTAAMERAMKKSVAAVRAILTKEQRVIFDSAVVKHEADMAAAKARGGNNAMACCMECMRPDGRADHMMPKKPDI